MRNQTRTIAVAAVMTALVGGSTAAVASTMGARPAATSPAAAKSAAAKSAAAMAKSHGSTATDRPGQDEMTASVARDLHVTTARAAAALQPLFAAGRADTSSATFATAARSLGVSPQQLNAALGQAKQSLAAHR